MNITGSHETIDTRWVFRTYVALAGVTGFILFGWGPVWLGADLAGDPFGKAALIRVFGAILMAACWAIPFALHGPQFDVKETIRLHLLLKMLSRFSLATHR
jgi:hypothetical protein